VVHLPRVGEFFLLFSASILSGIDWKPMELRGFRAPE
jgi:hypothetical protein